MEILSFIFYLIIAAACACIAEWVVPGTIPGGFITSAIVGVIGAWIGVSMMGNVGPALGGVSVIPCIVGSAVFVFLLYLISGGLNRKAI